MKIKSYIRNEQPFKYPRLKCSYQMDPFRNFHSNLPKTFFILKMNKKKSPNLK